MRNPRRTTEDFGCLVGINVFPLTSLTLVAALILIAVFARFLRYVQEEDSVTLKLK